jgi:hypothetical protein
MDDFPAIALMLERSCKDAPALDVLPVVVRRQDVAPRCHSQFIAGANLDVLMAEVKVFKGL